MGLRAVPGAAADAALNVRRVRDLLAGDLGAHRDVDVDEPEPAAALPPSVARAVYSRGHGSSRATSSGDRLGTSRVRGTLWRRREPAPIPDGQRGRVTVPSRLEPATAALSQRLRISAGGERRAQSARTRSRVSGHLRLNVKHDRSDWATSRTLDRRGRGGTPISTASPVSRGSSTRWMPVSRNSNDEQHRSW
jgi:hypothetical protein